MEKIKLDDLIAPYLKNGKWGGVSYKYMTTEDARKALLEFGKLLLERAADNAKLNRQWHKDDDEPVVYKAMELENGNIISVCSDSITSVIKDIEL